MTLHKVILLLATCFLASKSLTARIKIPIGERQILTKVHDLPNTKTFLIEEGHYLDLATIYSEYNVAYILPLWITSEPKVVGYDEIDNTYFEIPEKNLNTLLEEQKLNKASLIKIPFYSRYGGKIIVLTLASVILFSFIPFRKKTTKEQKSFSS